MGAGSGPPWGCRRRPLLQTEAGLHLKSGFGLQKDLGKRRSRRRPGETPKPASSFNENPDAVCRMAARTPEGRVRTGPGRGPGGRIARAAPPPAGHAPGPAGSGGSEGARAAGRAPIPVRSQSFDGYSSTFRDLPGRPRTSDALTCGNAGRRPRSTRGFLKSTRITEKTCGSRRA